MTELEKRHAAVPALTEWDYAPAPEARDIVSLDDERLDWIERELVKRIGERLYGRLGDGHVER